MNTVEVISFGNYKIYISNKIIENKNSIFLAYDEKNKEKVFIKKIDVNITLSNLLNNGKK
jgi:hypothetical protein